MKRAFSKLKLEHVVIGKGQFHQDKAKPGCTDVLEVCMLSFVGYENLNSKSCSRKNLIVAKINFASLKYSNTIFIHFCMGQSGHVCELKIMLTVI